MGGIWSFPCELEIKDLHKLGKNGFVEMETVILVFGNRENVVNMEDLLHDFVVDTILLTEKVVDSLDCSKVLLER